MAAIKEAIEPQRSFLDSGDLESIDILWFKKPGGPDTVQIQPRIKTCVDLTARHYKTA